jgi:hypothetical protein
MPHRHVVYQSGGEATAAMTERPQPTTTPFVRQGPYEYSTVDHEHERHFQLSREKRLLIMLPNSCVERALCYFHPRCHKENLVSQIHFHAA